LTAARRFRAGLIGLAGLIVLSTGAYVAFAGASVFDALYMVVTTITTVGFKEVFPLDASGRIITMVTVLTGFGLGFYTASAGIEHLLILAESRRSTRSASMLQTMLDTLDNHVILCGFGRVGSGVWDHLRSRGVEVLVVEADPVRADEAVAAGAHTLTGDATHNAVLAAAGIERARALVACVTSDADNLVIVLSARSLAPGLHIVSRAGEAEWEDKLRLAGADRVVAPQVVGSERLAAMAVETSLAEMFDVVVDGRPVEFAVDEVVISGQSPVAGETLERSGFRRLTGALLLAVEDPASRTLATPGPEQRLDAGTAVIVIGTPSQVRAAIALLAP